MYQDSQLRIQMHFRLFFITTITLAAAGCSQEASKPAPSQYADTLFINGSVYTMDATRSWADAVGLRDNNIIYVGMDNDADRLRGPDTRVIDLGGKMLMPAFQDAHIHPMGAGKKP